ncbi:MAG: hypothetical protein V1800_02125 [Candidatus Latescibacterota bacterium]
MSKHERKQYTPARLGEYFSATVPDTLDLAERGKLGISHCCAVLDEDNDHTMYFWGDPTSIDHHLADLIVQPKMFEAMAMLRVMSGSEWGLDRESRMIETMMSMLGEEGLWWVPPMGGRMPWLGSDDNRPYLNPHTPARMIRAMMAWYQYTGDPAWKRRTDRMVSAFQNILVVHKDDYAYVPVPSQAGGPSDYLDYLVTCYVKGRGWTGYVEPMDEKSVPGTEGSVLCEYGHMSGTLANWYGLTGNTEALGLAGKLARFYSKPRFWADWRGGEYCGVVGAEHAHWNGHVHGYMNTLRATLEYAIAANDARLKAWVREGYEWTRQPTLVRYGFVGDSQGCGCGRLIGLAVKLTDAGIGDYWEDVDLYIRNMGTEMQFTPDDFPGHTLPVPSGRLDPAGAMIGGFANAAKKERWMGCCSPHGLMGIFYAWDGTLGYSDGVARVNLLLNRASPWMDVDSYLPHEGKVILRNKQARTVVVRIPLWADKDAVRCSVDQKSVQPEWSSDRYVRIENLKAGDVVTIEFPMVERTEVLTAPSLAQWDDNYPGAPKSAESEPTTFTLRGNTIVHISKPIVNSPLFLSRAEKYRTNTVPMKKVSRFVTPLVLKW